MNRQNLKTRRRGGNSAIAESHRARGPIAIAALEKENRIGDAEKDGAPAIPEDALFVLPLRNSVLLPGGVMPLTVGRPRSIRAVEGAIERELPLALLAQKDPQGEEPGPKDLHDIGTVAEVQRMIVTPDGQRVVVVRGKYRFQAEDFVLTEPCLAVKAMVLVDRVPGGKERGKEFQARLLHLRQEALRAISLLPQEAPELAAAIDSLENPGQLIDLVASTLQLGVEEKQEILATVDLEERVRKVTAHLVRQIEVLSLSKKIGTETRSAIDKGQREYFLREQLKAIRKELGEDDPGAAAAAELVQKLDAAGMPPEVDREARAELARLERIPEGSAERSVIRTRLEWLAEMPWKKLSEERIDLPAARALLDAEHHGLEKVKQRIIEFLAVRKLNPEGKGPILCLVGPPGVGKTSLGRSIARAAGREFVSASLGGVHDESEIRGHRRTYVGALPGRIAQGMRKVGTRNPVFLLDEVDKLSASFHGDPSAALLEVLDPEQNARFEDHYLDVPFDLSRVLFITTANVRENIPGPLLDRMELIELSGYTEDEKTAIARDHLLPRQLAENGLKSEDVRFEEEALREIVRSYTREAGVRQLERELGSVCRSVAARIAETGRPALHQEPGAGGLSLNDPGLADTVAVEPVEIGPAEVRSRLGPHRYLNETALRTSLPGVATGLAWTPMGGDILFVEATRMPGKGQLILTGQLGDVMKESAQAALSLVRSHARSLGVPARALERSDIHIHLPSGAIPKDGPSAGVTLFVALVSLLTGRRVKNDVAMTGEVSLRGLVLPVGGIKEKVLAARRAGIRKVLLPSINRKDLEEVPAAARADLEFVYLERVEEALEKALENGSKKMPARSAEEKPRRPVRNASAGR